MMDDPWDVKSVRQFGQYTSCMKLNGVPLLPPVLSKECRKEMQYYKLLAKEVEKRISILQPYIESDTDSSETTTDAPDIPDFEQDFETKEVSKPDFNVHFKTITAKEKSLDETLSSSPLHTELYNLSPNPFVSGAVAQQCFVDYSVDLNETGRNFIENTKLNIPSSPPIEVPERDYNCISKRELLTDVETKNKEKNKIVEDIVNFSFTVSRDKFSKNSFTNSLDQDEPPSLTSKSFTGSLNNIHTESGKKTHIVPNLVRQRSYTILNPSPQLLAHLEVQSVNLGVEMCCFSMTDSLSNLSSPNKKRRSWDLESAKVKWSNMALELKQKNLTNPVNKSSKSPARGQVRAKSVASARTRRSSLSSKPSPKTESIQKVKRHSPPRVIPSDQTIILEEPMTIRTGKELKYVRPVKEPTSPKRLNHKEAFKSANHTKSDQQSPKSVTPKPQTTFTSEKSVAKDANKSTTPKSQLISESEDPASKVRELYEKIQRQQQVQMASLVEKQKREQMLLQQVFEEQNNLLFKQLKTICPKSPVEAKEAWVDKTREDKGPVSLSQLMNLKSPEKHVSPVTSTLTDSNKHINHCDSVLKKSRDISSSIKKQGLPQNQNSTSQSPQYLSNITRTNSPSRKSTPTSRRLNYDTSASDRDYEPMLTDRTNDTLADLNVTFTSDSEECRPFSHNNINTCVEDMMMVQPSAPRSTDSAIKCMEQTIQNSINSSCGMRASVVSCQPTTREHVAASKIQARVKGYLVRRLMKTARVQSTVQTIKDALLCALQLHQDREGIRGADVDLHRRLIQQITAACYCLHDTFIASSAAERCAMIAADRSRRASLASRPHHRTHTDIMSQSHSGVFPSRPKRFPSSSASLMTQSNYESYNSEKAGRARYMPSPRRRPWR